MDLMLDGGRGGANAGTHGADDLLLELVPIAEHLREMVDLAADQLHASCAVILRIGGQLCIIATTDDRAEAMSDWQFSHLSGPSLAAMDGDVAAHFTEGSAPQWPAYERFAAAQQCRSSMSMPLLVEGYVVGSLSAHRGAAQRFTVPEQQVAQQFAGKAAGVIGYLHRIALGVDLRAAVAGRSAIDTALGILMARGGYGGKEAMVTLRADAAARGVRLTQAAVELVSGASGGAVQ